MPVYAHSLKSGKRELYGVGEKDKRAHALSIMQALHIECNSLPNTSTALPALYGDCKQTTQIHQHTYHEQVGADESHGVACQQQCTLFQSSFSVLDHLYSLPFKPL